MTPIKQLSEAEFHGTFIAPMRRVGEDEEQAAVNIKQYVESCIKTHNLPATLDSIEINDVYISADARYSHIMLSYGLHNEFLVVVTDNVVHSVFGYFLLDLNAAYGAAKC